MAENDANELRNLVERLARLVGTLAERQIRTDEQISSIVAYWDTMVERWDTMATRWESYIAEQRMVTGEQRLFNAEQRLANQHLKAILERMLLSSHNGTEAGETNNP